MVGDSVRTIAVLDPVEAVLLAVQHAPRGAAMANQARVYRQLEERFANASQARAALVDEAVVTGLPEAYPGGGIVTEARPYLPDTVSKQSTQSDLDAHLAFGTSRDHRPVVHQPRSTWACSTAGSSCACWTRIENPLAFERREAWANMNQGAGTTTRRAGPGCIRNTWRRGTPYEQGAAKAEREAQA